MGLACGPQLALGGSVGVTGGIAGGVGAAAMAAAAFSASASLAASSALIRAVRSSHHSSTSSFSSMSTVPPEDAMIEIFHDVASTGAPARAAVERPPPTADSQFNVHPPTFVSKM